MRVQVYSRFTCKSLCAGCFHVPSWSLRLLKVLSELTRVQLPVLFDRQFFLRSICDSIAFSSNVNLFKFSWELMRIRVNEIWWELKIRSCVTSASLCADCSLWLSCTCGVCVSSKFCENWWESIFQPHLTCKFLCINPFDSLAFSSSLNLSLNPETLVDSLVSFNFDPDLN